MKEAAENSRVDIIQNDDIGAQIGQVGSGTRGRGSKRGACSGAYNSINWGLNIVAPSLKS